MQPRDLHEITDANYQEIKDEIEKALIQIDNNINQATGDRDENWIAEQREKLNALHTELNLIDKMEEADDDKKSAAELLSGKVSGLSAQTGSGAAGQSSGINQL
jgi:hypothetical protein